MAQWLVYLAMPVLAAALGYVTKRVAIEMMFRPLRFVGIPGTPVGWQGIVPRNAERTIRVAAEMLTTRLVDAREVVAGVDPDELTRRLEPQLLAVVDAVTRDVLATHHPGLWESLPVLAQDVVVKQIQAGIPDAVREVVTEIQLNIDRVLDIEELAVGVLRRDPAVVVRLIKDLSRPEMAFIARSGIWFGLALGLVQTLVWALTHQPAVLPLFGLAIGWLTDWLAIKLVFRPRGPRRVLGVFAFQGVFQRRRDEVARQYGELVATQVVTVPNILSAMLTGPGAPWLAATVRRVVAGTVDRQVSLIRPLVAVAVGEQRLAGMADTAAELVVDELPALVHAAQDYLTEVLDVGGTITTKMRDLSAVEYENLLRPAFRRDEWKLIAVGAAIGFVVGELQVHLFVS